jgi:hypothetical protein
VVSIDAGRFSSGGPDRAGSEFMDIQIATLCDFAADYGNGKLVINGTFDALRAAQLPVVHPHCSLAMRICVLPEDSGEHKMTINIIDEDGKSVDPSKMPIRADMPIKVPDEVPFLTRNLVLNFQGLKFPDEGIYHVDVTIDGELVIRLPLRVVKVENPVPPGQSAEG